MRSGTNRRLAAWVLLAGVLGMVGCGKSDSGPTTPSTCTGSVDDLTTRVNRAIPVGAVIPTGLDTAATVFSLRVDSLGTPIATGASALLAERPALLRLTSGGDITVSSGAVSQLMFDDSLCIALLGGEAHVYSTFTSTAGASLALPFDGTSPHRFVAAGREFPAFDESIVSLPPMQILSPAANFSMADTATLDITWTPVSSDTNVKVVCQLRDSAQALARSVVVPDAAGAARILGTAVATLQTHANVVLTVARYRIERRTVGSASRPLALLCEVTDQRPILLTDPAPFAAARARPAPAEGGSNGERFLRLPAWTRRH